MRADLEKLREWTLAELADRRGNPIDGGYHAYIDAEVTRRIAQAQIDAARWMRWSVIALGVAAAATAIFQGLAWIWPNPLHLH